MDLDLSPKLSKLFCELKLERINKEYGGLERRYKQIDELFSLPETKERNLSISTMYSDFYKKAEEFHNILDYAKKQFSICNYNLKKKVAISACSKKICGKKISKKLDMEWTEDIGTVAKHSEEISLLEKKLKNYAKRVADRTALIKQGIGCMTESLEKEEQTLKDYAFSMDKRGLELVHLLNDKHEKDTLLLTSNLQILASSLIGLYLGMEERALNLGQSTSWIYCKLSSAPQDRIEKLENKIGKITTMRQKYKLMRDKISRLLNLELLKNKTGQRTLILQN